MFEYFPGNYVWNLAVVATLNSGGYIDEVDRACRPVRDLALQGADAGTDQLYAAWSAVADGLIASAEEDVKRGRLIGAGDKFRRASLYVSQSERLQAPNWPGRKAAYRHSIDLLKRAAELGGANIIPVEVPYEGGSLPAYFVPAPGEGPKPCVIQWNGLDSTKEMMFYSGFGDENAARGVSTLMVDTPGSGEALRLRDLRARPDTEVWAAACVDYLESRDDVDHDRIGLVGWSLGGYYAPRAAAYEKRIKLVVAWGANHDWGEVQHGRLRREGENPVPHYWEHVYWVWGAQGRESFFAIADRVTLEGVIDKITVPFLVTHGVNDRQISVNYAHKSYEGAINSPKRELRLFTPEEGGAEHIGIDNLRVVGAYVADWIAETI
ncbi:alpha/beta fold hydrolase [Actinoplanes sp. NPDC051851]|uniref:alpha/beta hydrolase family protein n=1 Tax=Actinoplanes sp. NPDC051851 TaxID=3154753 RepID=UPI003424D1A1